MGAAALLAAYAADITLGDPARFHPVAGFGALALGLERRIYAPTRLRGAVATAVMVSASAAGANLTARCAGRSTTLAAFTWAALGGRSLRAEAAAVDALLVGGDLDAARSRLRGLCGRDASALEPAAIRAALIESLAENSSDAVVAALLWACLLGPSGVAAYRAANTLDALWGHHGPRYEEFGWAPAHLDDLLNWIPARLTAALATVAAPLVGGSGADAWTAIRRDAGAHPSPNAGVVEAAFAGALGVRLGGPLAYAGRVEVRPELFPAGTAPTSEDVRDARRLSAVVCAAALVVLVAARWSGSTRANRWRQDACASHIRSQSARRDRDARPRRGRR